MEPRLIDANRLFDFLTEQLDKETGAYKKGRNVGLNTARSALHDETITPTIAPPPNAPLTLEELREMNWEPVWAESLANPDVRCWGYHCQNRVICSHGYCGFFLDDEYGKTWLAYRRKPEEVQT